MLIRASIDYSAVAPGDAVHGGSQRYKRGLIGDVASSGQLVDPKQAVSMLRRHKRQPSVRAEQAPRPNVQFHVTQMFPMPKKSHDGLVLVTDCFDGRIIFAKKRFIHVTLEKTWK